MHILTSKSKNSLSLPYFALTGPDNLQCAAEMLVDEQYAIKDHLFQMMLCMLDASLA